MPPLPPAPDALPVVINADDYALSPGVSRGILALLDAGRLSGTSCMTATPYWPEHAAWLRPLAGRPDMGGAIGADIGADIGLHLTLTDQTPAGSMPLLAPDGKLPPVGRLIGLALRGRLSRTAQRAEIEAQITRQLDLFEAHLGRPPDHVDGHQHVHVLPGVRGPLLDILARRYPGPQRPYLRDCAEPWARLWRRGVEPGKSLVISALATGFAAAARRRGFMTNPSFRGAYGFSAQADFPALMARFLAPAQAGALVMVHPALRDEALAAIDPVVESRYTEQSYLAGAAFPALLERMGLRVARLRDALA